MNVPRLKLILCAACRLGMLLALLAVCEARAADPAGGGRWLLIFDTSSTMKKMLPGTEVAIRDFFTSSADGQLQAGDSMGIWAMNQQVNAQFPTFTWSPEHTGLVISNLTAFLHSQRYSGASQLAALKTPMNYVVGTSRRLTIVLFTDGQSEIAGTTYDEGVNQTFRDIQSARAKDGQLVIVVMRSQFGQFTGCTLSFPPGSVNFPPFPAPPAPPVTSAPPAKPANLAPAVVPALMIVGTQVSTNGTEPPPLPKVISPPKTNLPVVKPPVPATNPPAISATQAVALPKPAATNPVVATIHATNAPPMAVGVQTSAPPPAVSAAQPAAVVTKTNPVVATTTGPDPSSRRLIYAGVALLVVAVVVVVAFIARGARRPQTSLISRSMEDEPSRK